MVLNQHATEAPPVAAPFLERCFLFDAVEDAYPITGVRGTIPAWLRGCYYVNGPARFQRGSLHYRHWLDGDGMVCALRFEEGGVRFASRFVRTPKMEAEEAAGRPVFRTFGTSFEGDRLRRGVMLEPPANVSVYPFAGTLLAFSEQALPYEMDPSTLETRGEYDFHGSLNDVSPFAAHPKFDPATGHLFNFGISFSPVKPVLNLYEFDPDGRLLRRRRHALRMAHSNHDFALSPDFAVFYFSPLAMNFERFWSQGFSVMESLEWEPSKGSYILVLPRGPQRGEPFEVRVGSAKCLHLINSFQRDRRLVVDVLELLAPVYPEYEVIPDLFSDITPCHPVRYEIDLDSRELAGRKAMQYDRGPDFPSLDKRLVGQPYDDFWMLGISATGQTGRKFFDQLAHGRWTEGAVNDIFQTQPGEYLAGEPIFVAGPDAGTGVVIVQWIDARRDRSEILLFDPACVARGPIAALELRHKLHPGFHASFLGA